MSPIVQQLGDAREEHERFEVSVASCYPVPHEVGFAANSGLPGDSEGEDGGTPNETGSSEVLRSVS